MTDSDFDSDFRLGLPTRTSDLDSAENHRRLGQPAGSLGSDGRGVCAQRSCYYLAVYRQGMHT